MVLRLVLVVLVVAVILWWLSARARIRPPQRPPTQHEPEAFARCAHCGVHLPMNDAVIDRGIAYCSEAHRLAGPKDRGAS